ncbi:translation initiation factor IF-2 [Almyronema epifaneia]|uniref:Translation initiation factor IF-2 n=1 Tax=Almyronema epifaneia S1 TaxID=2991925 RepID=A0ABW6IGS9_9CYAN
MNNAKVRIYELSKELNLDNKDILAICDRLNISAKSHSSTITEEEASQIRSAASKYSPSAVTSGQSSAKLSKPTRQKNGAQRPVRKQQILEIRHSRSGPIPPKATDDMRPPERPKPTAPVSSNAAERVEAVASSPSRPVARPISPKPKQPDNRETEATALSSPPTPPPSKPTASAPARPEQAPKQRPQLVRPPSRSANEAAESIPEAPVEPAAKQPESSVELLTPPRPQRPKRVEAPSRPTPVDEDSRSEGSPDRETAQLKPKPELKRPKPKRPSRSEDADVETDSDSEETSSPTEIKDDADQPILRRPTPPRTSKRKEREEDDEQEMRRASKVTKAKRRSQPVLDDEDEDLAEVIDAGQAAADMAPSQLSVSLARPPKPKSARPTSQPKPAAAKNRKPTFSKESSRNQRRDRQQDNQPQRPERIVVTTGLTVNELADKIMVADTEIIRFLFIKGIATNVNQTLDIPTIEMVAEEYEVEVETAEVESEARKVTEMLAVEDLENLERRPPVVTIMGHVDHGKTTLLDSIRKTKVAQGEAGGITQHIGAYHVDIDHNGDSQQIVFLDTPGHEAFTAMRARGTRVTDIAILVVAADDGVRPQTIEAISHAKAAEVPLLVAINKIDKEAAQPDRVKQELMEHGLVPEEWGGDTIMVPVSALQGEHLDDLLEMILLVAEVEDLHANPNRPAKGTVIEANLDKARGPVATLLVQNGTLRVGDSIVVGSVFGKVRAMIDDRGNRVEAATPSFAVEVLGLNDVPAAGDEFDVFKDEKVARATANSRADTQRQSRLQQAMASRRITLNSLSAQAQEGDLKELNLLLKADVQGSLEAILGALQQLPQDEVQIRVLLAAPGEISETDVDLAAASGAVIIGFNTTLAPGARQAADRAGVDVRDYEVIYKLLDDVQGAMEGLLEPELVEEPLGQVEVRAVFPLRKGTVAGSYVQSGKVTRNCRIRVMRRGEVIFEGNLDSLKRMKEDVKEVNAGFECGIGVDSFNGWEEGDTIEAFRLVSKRRTLAMA